MFTPPVMVCFTVGLADNIGARVLCKPALAKVASKDSRPCTSYLLLNESPYTGNFLIDTRWSPAALAPHQLSGIFSLEMRSQCNVQL